MERQVHVVMGSTGEYSDRTEWPVKAFDTLEDAKAHEHAADVRAKEVEPIWSENRWDWEVYDDGGPRYRRKVPPEAQNQFDPKMEMTHTGTSYYTMSVDFEERPDRYSQMTVQELAKETQQVQDACNLSGVLYAFAEVMKRLRALFPEGDTKFFNTHPIVQAWTDKLAELSDVHEVYHASHCHVTVDAMAEGIVDGKGVLIKKEKS